MNWDLWSLLWLKLAEELVGVVLPEVEVVEVGLELVGVEVVGAGLELEVVEPEVVVGAGLEVVVEVEPEVAQLVGVGLEEVQLAEAEWVGVGLAEAGPEVVGVEVGLVVVVEQSQHLEIQLVEHEQV